jgi:hypothetical protein
MGCSSSELDLSEATLSYPQTTPNSPQVGVVHLGGQQQLVQYAYANPATVAVTHIVPVASVPPGYQVAVLSMLLSSAGTAAGNFQDTTGTPVVLSGTFTFAAGSQVNAQLGAEALFMTSPGQGLDWNQTAGTVTVGITVSWCLFRQATP